MKRLSFVSVVCLLLAAPAYLLSQSASMTDMPAADADAFWDYITDRNPYTEWKFYPGHEGMYPGQSPHGAFLKLYVNQAAYDAVQAGQKTMPPGAILVKENYAENKKTLAAVTPMYKVAGYNPEAGDWFWAKYGADGKIAAAGKPDGCINCHRSVKNNDWIFSEAK
jgi:hypothetical protein